MSTCVLQLPSDFEDRYKVYRDNSLIQRGLKEPPFDWSKLSLENLDIARRVIKVTINTFELHGTPGILVSPRIPVQKYVNESLHPDDVEGILGRIEGLKVANDTLRYQRKEYERNRIVPPGGVSNYDSLDDFLPSNKDLDDYIYVRVTSTDDLYRTRDRIAQLLAAELPTPVESAAVQSDTLPSVLKVSVSDRIVRVGPYVISKPYAAGGNMEFLEYILENTGKPIKKTNLPEYAKNAIGKKRIGKVLNELGFKGEILKAFCPKRSKGSLTFLAEVSRIDLQQRGVKIPLLAQELKTADMKNSPK